MFIRQDNTLKWKWIIIGAVITLALVFAGIFGGDKIVYSLIHPSNCNVWMPAKSFLCSLRFLV